MYYLGLMDKVYGIRIVDHTAFSRAKTGIAMNDQSHGMVAQWSAEPWEVNFNYFIGNLGQENDLRQKGFSLMVEKDLAEKHRIGGAYLGSNNSYIKEKRLEIHSKFGYGQGNSLLAEVGMIQDTANGSSTANATYAFIENMAYLNRGYNFISQIDYYNKSGSSQSPDLFRWTFGILAFPLPKWEFRSTLVNYRSQSDSGVSPDAWQLQIQAHASL
jgi:hypothetical protein